MGSHVAVLICHVSYDRADVCITEYKVSKPPNNQAKTLPKSTESEKRPRYLELETPACGGSMHGNDATQ